MKYKQKKEIRFEKRLKEKKSNILKDITLQYIYFCLNCISNIS